MMRSIIVVLLLFLHSLTLHAEEKTPRLLLAENGKTEYGIRFQQADSSVEQTAAAELSSHLRLATGAIFPIIGLDSEKKPSESIPLKSFWISSDPSLPYDGISIRTEGSDIFLAGHPQRGPLYAVYQFLEEAVGIRWWTSGETFIPKKTTLAIEPVNMTYAPKLIYREAYYFDPLRRGKDSGIFSARMRCNGANNPISPEFGDHHRFQYFVHSFFPLLPPEKYFADHPDWYSEINGRRKHEQAQLCLTNDAMRAELTKNALESLRKNPQAKFLSISQNDWHGYCTCEKCTKLAGNEESQAGPLLHFVNAVAEAVEKEFPDVYVETLAYQYTRKPPKHVRPRDNVVIRLCTIECSFVQPLAVGEQNRPLREDMEGWSRIAKNLFVWDYVTNFHQYMIPHPNYFVLGDNIDFFVKNNTIGLFEQGDAHCVAGDFVEMRNWVISRLMWNPRLDADALIREFLNGYYGDEAVAAALYDYLRFLSDRAVESGVYLRCFRKNCADWLDLDAMNEATRLMNKAFDAAQKAEQTAPESHRGLVAKIERSRLALDHAWLLNWRRFKRESQASGKAFLGPADPQAAARQFFDRCDTCGVKAFHEWQTVSETAAYRDALTSRFSPAAPTPEICKDLPLNSWIDFEEADFTLHKSGTWTFLAADANAANGMAVKMPGDHFEWAASLPFDRQITKLADKSGKAVSESGRYRIYAWVRCEATAPDGKAMTLGIYDTKLRRGMTHRTLSVPEINGPEYRMIDLGLVPLTDTMYFWAAPPKRPGEVQAVYVDRVVLIRDDHQSSPAE